MSEQASIAVCQDCVMAHRRHVHLRIPGFKEPPPLFSTEAVFIALEMAVRRSHEGVLSRSHARELIARRDIAAMPSYMTRDEFAGLCMWMT